jgi:hypothetical protein
MPRTNSSSSQPKSAFHKVVPGGSLTQRTPVASLVHSAPPTPVVPAPKTVVVEQQSSVWQSMKQGFGWGIGSSIARNMFGGGPTVSPIVPPSPSSVVSVPTNTTQDLGNQPAYTQCRKEGGDHEACAHYLS